MKEKLKNIIVENQRIFPVSRLIPRQTDVSLDIEKMQAIIGPRRIGKTSMLLLTMEELKKDRNIPVEKILYFNFEDERIRLEQSSLDLLLQAWKELHPETELSDIWYFFDEVQAAPGWERFLNRINEKYTKRIFFTGSNSSVLHTNIKSVMRGRSIAVEVLPLSFGEFMDFKGLSPVVYGAEKAKTLVAFDEYLRKGGYPEIVLLDQKPIYTSYLQEYYNAMLLRDIVDYNQISNFSYLRELYRHASQSIGKKISVRRLYNQLKTRNFQVGINSVYEAMDFAEQAYLFKRIDRFDYSAIKRANSDKKIYWIDNGLLNANTTRFSDDKGLLLENSVFWALYKKYGNIYSTNIYYYAESGGECDFVVYQEGDEALPIQVSWSVSDPETRDREIKGLIKACMYCKVDRAWIVTAEEEGNIEENGIRISVKAAWKWMLTEI